MRIGADIIRKFREAFGEEYLSYDDSIISSHKGWFFLAKDSSKKYLFILGKPELLAEFEGEVTGVLEIGNANLEVKKSFLNFWNLEMMQKNFPHLSPSYCGLKPSFGTGDRLGIATCAQARAFKDRSLFPFLAQQSARELNRTKRCWQDVICDAVWGVIESGYKGPFGADADHIKQIEDLKYAIDCGYSMFTIDPSDYILAEADRLDKAKIKKLYNSIDQKGEIEKSYLGREIKLGRKILKFDETSLLLIAVSYWKAIEHIAKCYDFIRQNKRDEFDFEVSMDETENAISPLAHFFIINELQKKGVRLQNLALRFPGQWQKAVDYIGSIEEFAKNLKLHAMIAKRSGGYKLSLHSGSEKFSVYKIFSEATQGLFHIKTAGTSWLQSLKVIAIKNPKLFKEMYNYAFKKYQDEKKSYHVSAQSLTVPEIGEVPEDEYKSLFDLKKCCQMLHVTFGPILTAKRSNKYIFKDKIYESLFVNESLHYKYITENIDMHIGLLST